MQVTAVVQLGAIFKQKRYIKAMVEIVQKEAPVLREKAEAVPLSEITGPKIQKILQDMKAAMDSQDDGVAIAAPQIGINLRMFIVSRKVFALMEHEGELEGVDIEQYKDLVCINPKIISVSKTKKEMEEGCLSVRWLYGKVKRSTKATIEAYDGNGKKFTRGGSGLLAQAFQHETDHLDGVLFIDKANDVKDIPPETL
jgi:peptide deformylase